MQCKSTKPTHHCARSCILPGAPFSAEAGRVLRSCQRSRAVLCSLSSSQRFCPASAPPQGMLGANFGPSIMTALGYKDTISRGLAAAATAGGLGTASLTSKEPEALPFCALSYSMVRAERVGGRSSPTVSVCCPCNVCNVTCLSRPSPVSPFYLEAPCFSCMSASCVHGQLPSAHSRCLACCRQRIVLACTLQLPGLLLHAHLHLEPRRQITSLLGLCPSTGGRHFNLPCHHPCSTRCTDCNHYVSSSDHPRL